MYSLILMTALSTAPDTAEFNGLFRRMFHKEDEAAAASCHGSGSGSGYGSCSGKSNGCTGSSSSGGGLFGHRMRAFNQSSSSSTCYGSCYGKSKGCSGSSSHSNTCHGSGFGCTGSSYTSCQGSSMSCTGMALNCSGGGFAPSYPSGGVPYDYAMPAPTASFAYAGDPSCTACGTPPAPGGGFPAPVPGSGVAPAVPMPASPPPTIPESPSSRTTFAPIVPASGTTGRATVIVRLPADARLYAEDRLLNLSSGERSFVTPVLPGQQDFLYTFRAEYQRNGETISQAKRVPVRAGGSVTIEFIDLTTARVPKESPNKPASLPTSNPGGASGVAATGLQPIPPTIRNGTPTVPTASSATPTSTNPPLPTIAPLPTPVGGAAPSDRARITVKLPPGATLYVDGRKNERSDLTREFNTPPLPPGQEFAYLMKAEVMREGRPEYQMTKVTFRAGELVTVDFTAAPGR